MFWQSLLPSSHFFSSRFFPPILHPSPMLTMLSFPIHPVPAHSLHLAGDTEETRAKLNWRCTNVQAHIFIPPSHGPSVGATCVRATLPWPAPERKTRALFYFTSYISNHSLVTTSCQRLCTVWAGYVRQPSQRRLTTSATQKTTSLSQMSRTQVGKSGGHGGRKQQEAVGREEGRREEEGERALW